MTAISEACELTLGEILRGPDEGLFVIDSKGVAYYRLVKTGKTFGNQIEILSGLDDGEHVAVSKIDQLSDGVRVQTS